MKNKKVLNSSNIRSCVGNVYCTYPVVFRRVLSVVIVVRMCCLFRDQSVSTAVVLFPVDQ